MKNETRPSILIILGLFALGGVIAILSAACASISNLNPFSDSVSEEEALIALYNSTNGAEWGNNDLWLSDLHIGTWHGIRYYRDERLAPGPGGGTHIVEGVAGLNLESNGLSGEIPPELGNLAFLSRLFLSGNLLSGEIPSELGSLSNLSHLYLSNNQLTGEIPPKLGKLDFLSYLSLRGNRLSGEIPSEMGSIRDLIMLNLSHNNLGGEIPSELGNLGLYTLGWLGSGHKRPDRDHSVGIVCAHLRTMTF